MGGLYYLLNHYTHAGILYVIAVVHAVTFSTGYIGNIMMTLIPAMFAKHTFKLTIVQVTSSYCTQCFPYVSQPPC